MAYKEFSYFYDFFNEHADYDALFAFTSNWIKEQGLENCILCDLGCGTGEMAFRFDKAGYDVIAIDNSMEMLDVLYDKKYELGAENILVLNQDITNLDMYGTVGVFLCTFDTVNHLEGRDKVQQLFDKVSLFMEPNGVFIFDANTPYKHMNVLANNQFDLSHVEADCLWNNQLDKENYRTKISIDITDKLANKNYSEEFYEHYYDLEQLKTMLKQSNLSVIKVVDGEDFTALKPESQRYLIMVKKEQ